MEILLTFFIFIIFISIMLNKLGSFLGNKLSETNMIKEYKVISVFFRYLSFVLIPILVIVWEIYNNTVPKSSFPVVRFLLALLLIIIGSFIVSFSSKIYRRFCIDDYKVFIISDSIFILIVIINFLLVHFKYNLILLNLIKNYYIIWLIRSFIILFYINISHFNIKNKKFIKTIALTFIWILILALIIGLLLYFEYENVFLNINMINY